MKYSVAEMDRMRQAIKDIHIMSWRRHPNGSCDGVGISMKSGEHEKLIEEYLRSYMLNGTTPEELEVAAQEKKRTAPLATRRS